MSYSGFASGKLRLESSDRMIAEDILKFRPELQLFLDDIEKKGWRYLYIETRGTSVAEIDLDGSPYKVRIGNVQGTSEMGPHQDLMEIELGQKLPTFSGVPKVQTFKINLSTKSFPRAATVDIAKGLVTYINEAFWSWQNGWEKDAKKLSEAREVQDVANWLFETKRQKLHESYSMERYNEILKLLEEK